jgi:hypothetical protein
VSGESLERLLFSGGNPLRLFHEQENVLGIPQFRRNAARSGGIGHQVWQY